MADNKEHICDLCHKRYATGYVMMGTGGHQIVKWLCPECAKQVNAGGGFFDDVLNGLDNMFQAMILGNPVKSADPERKRSRRVCPVCGATEEEIASSYKFGCSECYKVFYDLAHSYVAQLGGSEYKGKGPSNNGAVRSDDAPKREQNAKSLADYVEELRKKMHEAGERGDYDLASQLKHQIASLTGGDGK